MEILFFDRVRKPNPDDNKYLEYRKNTKMFYADESLKNLKSEKLRIETRLEDRKQDNAYGALAVVLAFLTLLVTVMPDEMKKTSIYFFFFLFFSYLAIVIFCILNAYRKDECTQFRIALQVLDELIAEKEESKTVNGAKQYNVTVVSK